jgi:hypothetical protein
MIVRRLVMLTLVATVGSAGCGSSRSDPGPDAIRLKSYLSAMHKVQVRRDATLRLADAAYYARINPNQPSKALRLRLRRGAMQFRRLAETYGALAAAADAIDPPQPLASVHAKYVASLAIAAGRDAKFGSDLAHVRLDPIILAWETRLANAAARILRMRQAWRVSVVRYSQRVDLELPVWVRQVGTVVYAKKNRDPLAAYIAAANTLDERRVAALVDVNEAANNALSSATLSFEDWYDTVLRFVGSGASLTDLHAASDLAAFTAASAANRIEARAEDFGDRCVTATRRYADAIATYAQTLGSGVANESYARAAQAGQSVEDHCSAH